jgi:hypothetical protein
MRSSAPPRAGKARKAILQAGYPALVNTHLMVDEHLTPPHLSQTC